jgi:hypothetical protein
MPMLFNPPYLGHQHRGDLNTEFSVVFGNLPVFVNVFARVTADVCKKEISKFSAYETERHVT